MRILDKESIIDLGWEVRKENQYTMGDHIMSVHLNFDEGVHLVAIKSTEGVLHNVWENSYMLFYGMIKTVDDLRKLMVFLEIVEEIISFSVGAQFRNLRKLQGMSQGDVADIVGTTYQYIGEIERGVVDPSVSMAQKVAKALNCELGILTNGIIMPPKRKR